MRSREFILELCLLGLIMTMLMIYSNATPTFSLGVNVGDVYSWTSTRPLVGKEMKIRIEEIEVEADDQWEILYSLKSWSDYDYDGYLHICDVGTNFNEHSYFCPLPVNEFLVYYGSLVDWKWNVSIIDNKMTIEDEFQTQTWVYDINNGVLIEYSTENYAFIASNIISNFDVSILIGVLGISVIGLIYTVKKKIIS